MAKYDDFVNQKVDLLLRHETSNQEIVKARDSFEETVFFLPKNFNQVYDQIKRDKLSVRLCSFNRDGHWVIDSHQVDTMKLSTVDGKLIELFCAKDTRHNHHSCLVFKYLVGDPQSNNYQTC